MENLLEGEQEAINKFKNLSDEEKVIFGDQNGITGDFFDKNPSSIKIRKFFIDALMNFTTGEHISTGALGDCEHTKLANDFRDKCGYSQEEADIAASNVMNEDLNNDLNLN